MTFHHPLLGTKAPLKAKFNADRSASVNRGEV